jgi:endonuclease/exonuclease/phosphatase family metal-dependent hydrolase
VSFCAEIGGQVELQKMAVMLVGDFNIASTDRAYRTVKKILGTCAGWC